MLVQNISLVEQAKCYSRLTESSDGGKQSFRSHRPCDIAGSDVKLSFRSHRPCDIAGFSMKLSDVDWSVECFGDINNKVAYLVQTLDELYR